LYKRVPADHQARQRIIVMHSLKEDTNLNTFMAKAADVQRKWYVVDAEGVVLGRLATQVATVLRGKHKPIYTPHVDTGDYVIIVNAAKTVLTGKKLDQKVYYHHSGFPGGLKETIYRKLMAEKPEFAVKKAIVGMLPKGPLGRQMARKLRVYAGAEHEYESRKPEKMEL
jgi:large subunit ribosomal protein L13